MKIQVFTTHCAACETMSRNVEEAVRQMGLDCGVEHVTRIVDMVEHGVTGTPALKVNGQIESVGRALDVEAIKQILADAGPERESTP